MRSWGLNRHQLRDGSFTQAFRGDHHIAKHLAVNDSNGSCGCNYSTLLSIERYQVTRQCSSQTGNVRQDTFRKREKYRELPES